MASSRDDTATTELTDAKPITFTAITACLVIIYDANKELVCRRVDLSNKSTCIGRDQSMDFVLASEKVSRRHARVETSERGSAIIDEGSTNGTFVNDIRLQPNTPRVLRTGDQIRLGSIVLRYLSGNDLESQFQEEIFQLTEYDTLTGLRSRRHFFGAIAREVTRCKRYGRPLSLLSIDIDHFKKVNDTWGHDVGDAVLRLVGQSLLAGVEPSALCARLSGEELVVLLPETELSQAAKVAETLRAGVERAAVPVGHEEVSVTISIGCAQWMQREKAAALLKRADQKLYRAKSDGRNRVRF